MPVKVGFIGLGVHFASTKSTQFLIEVLQSQWAGTEVWPHEETWIRISAQARWDLLVYFQHIPPRWEIEALGARRVVLVPMFDACPKEKEFWEPYRGCAILAFSTTLAKLFSSWGHEVHVVQYTPPLPVGECDWSGGLRGFFWPRRPELSWRHIRPLVPGGMSLHLHQTESLPSPTAEEVREHKITFSRWFEDPREMQTLLASKNVYFAPRRYEGIGMSYLEALGWGMAVVAPDQPTMNEVIRHGVDGWLYDPDAPTMPDWSQAQAWGTEARRAQQVRRRNWEQSIPGLIDFVTPRGPNPVRRHRTRRFRAIVTTHLRFWLQSRVRAAKRILKKVLARG